MAIRWSLQSRRVKSKVELGPQKRKRKLQLAHDFAGFINNQAFDNVFIVVA